MTWCFLCENDFKCVMIHFLSKREDNLLELVRTDEECHNLSPVLLVDDAALVYGSL